jgi:hypothetical protein
LSIISDYQGMARHRPRYRLLHPTQKTQWEIVNHHINQRLFCFVKACLLDIDEFTY